MHQNFVDFFRNYPNTKFAVAVSGGVDSVCLLCWMAQLGLDIVALHVNHGLRTAADEETQYVQNLCSDFGVPCKIFYWDGDKPTTGLEAAARTARYKLMTGWCRENNVSALVVAHQADDQIETFLMNLGRGSGLVGLAAMRAVSERDGIKILRPLLNVYRRDLVKYCDCHNIKYYHDEMNSDPHYTRVKIRQNRALLQEQLGISDDRILLAINNLGRSRDAMTRDVNACVAAVLQPDGCALFFQSFLFDLDGDIRLKFLGTLVQKIGGDDYQPRLNSLTRALENLQSDCKFTLGHCTLRRFGDEILVVPEGARTSFRKRHEKQKRRFKKN